MTDKKKALVAASSRKSTAHYMNILTGFGVATVGAASGMDAAQIYEEDPTFDLVVLDIDMPVMNGVSLAKSIRRYEKAKRPFIVGVNAVGSGPPDRALLRDVIDMVLTF